MTTNRNPSSLARQIQERLQSAQEPTAPAAAPDAPPAPPQGIRVTKDGRRLGPNESTPLGPDGNPLPVTTVPAATFHAER